LLSSFIEFFVVQSLLYYIQADTELYYLLYLLPHLFKENKKSCQLFHSENDYF